MRNIYKSILYGLLPFTCFAQDQGTKRLILLGDVGESIQDNTHFLNIVRKNVLFDSNTTVLYLGNNTTQSLDTTALKQEAAIIEKSEAKAVFITGYHDWASGKNEGYNAILKQQSFLEHLNNNHVNIYPADACPGPKTISLTNDVELVFLNTQWWLQDGDKPGIESGCKYRSKQEVLAELENIVKSKFDKLVW
ncbi:MAG: metallophosphoesterase [Chitinophagaceae bacterium]|nr:metallophosphoesterase [Chitinophagaceae bacterium]